MPKKRQRQDPTPFLPGLEVPSDQDHDIDLTDVPSEGIQKDEFDLASAAINRLASESKPRHRNEATTRLHLIDSLFFECLGWQKDNCTAEEPHGQEYADYVFHAPWKAMIVEAKKEGTYFEIPTTRRKQLIRNLTPVLQGNQPLKMAAEQVASYCQTRGIPVAVIANGFQLIAFLGSRDDGTPPLEGRALIFDSLQRIKANFLQFWNALNPTAIRQQNLKSLLAKSNPPRPPKRVSSFIANYPGFKQRNDLQADLEIVADLVFNDITGSRELETQFLEECYCKSGALSKHSSLTRSILEARYAHIFSESQKNPTTRPAVNKDGSVSNDLIAEGLSKRPIVLVGDVGVGKTTFLRKLIKIDAADILAESIIIYLDLGRSATLTSSLRDYILQEIPVQLKESENIDIYSRNTVRGIYHSDLESFASGIHGDLKQIDPDEFKRKEIGYLEELISDKPAHVKRSLLHITYGQKRNITLILDNCDQRDEAVQQQAFLIAEEIASSWPCLVFLSLRPSTFDRSRKKGALTGYHPKAFTISPPRLDLMLEKRLAFANRICRGEIPLESVSVSTRFSKLDAFISVFRSSLARNKELHTILDDLSDGNMRLALDLVRDFIISGHINTKKILSHFEKGGSYVIPTHEFLRAVIFRDNNYYDPESSEISNAFHRWSHDSSEFFLLPILLSELSLLGESIGTKGFVDANKLIGTLQEHGFIPDQIRKALSLALDRNLAQAAGRLIPEVSEDPLPAVRITSLGHHHLSFLLRRFVYLDAILVDVRLEDEKAARRFATARTLEERLRSVQEFIEILNDVWTEKLDSSSSFNWFSYRDSIKKEIARIRNR